MYPILLIEYIFLIITILKKCNFFFFLIPVGGGPQIVTTVVPLGSQPTHMICPHCYAEIDTATKTEPGLIAYISGVIIALLG